MPEASLKEVVQHAIGRPRLVLQHLTGDPDEQTVTVGGAEGGADLFGDHLGDSVSVPLPNMVEEAHGVVLDHDIVR